MPAHKCLCVCACICVVQDVEALMAVVRAQDASGPFRRLLGSATAAGAKVAGKGQGLSGAMGLKRQEEDSQARVSSPKCMCVCPCVHARANAGAGTRTRANADAPKQKT